MKPTCFALRSGKILPLFFTFIYLNTAAQDSSFRQVTDVLRVSFLNPGVSYEKAIGQSQTLFGHAFINTLISIQRSSYSGTETKFSFDPALLLQYRFYYNYKQREKAGKRTAYNSLNYVGPIVRTLWSKADIFDNSWSSAELERRLVTTIGGIWGFQRNYPKHFSLDLNLGLGYVFANSSRFNFQTSQMDRRMRGTIGFIGDLTLGFWLNRK